MDFTNDQNNYEILSPKFKVEQIKKKNCNTARYKSIEKVTLKHKIFDCYAFKNGIININLNN